MSEFLIIRFSNENGVIEAEIGWSADGRVFSDPKETALVILPGKSTMLVDKTMRQLVASLCETLPEQAADDDEHIRNHADKALGYLADAVHSEREIDYTLDADAGQLPPTIRR